MWVSHNCEAENEPAWVCHNCEAENEPALTKCNVCDTPRSATVSSPSVGPQLTGSGKAPPAELAPVIGVIGILLFGVLIAALGTRAAQLEEATFRAASTNIDLLKVYVRDCWICAFKSEASVEISKLDRNEVAEREERSYQAGRGNLDGLRAHVSRCEICTFKSAAEDEIKQLERAELAKSEERAYQAARGNLSSMRTYKNSCQVCAFKPEANDEIRALEEEEERRRNPTVTFKIKSNHPKAVALSFHSSSDKSRTWPGGALRDSDVHPYKLSCHAGETICFGAWVAGSALNPYWGAGYGGRYGCQNCCFVCPSGETAPIVLEPKDAKQPTPNIIWKIKSRYPYSVAVAFFSATRNLSWPGGGQGWVISDATEHTYNLSCMAGERICYGAWASGSPAAIQWGVGASGQNGCTNCCHVCDGKEYPITLGN
jgi:hypothetical protein